MGYGGSIYSLQPKNSRWAKGYPETPGICPETPGNPDFQPGNSTQTLRAMGSGVSGPIPGVSGYGRGKTPVFAPLSFLWLTSVCLGSLEH